MVAYREGLWIIISAIGQSHRAVGDLPNSQIPDHVRHIELGARSQLVASVNPFTCGGVSNMLFVQNSYPASAFCIS